MIEQGFADGSQIVIVNHPSGTSDVLLQLHGRQVSRVVIVPMVMRIGAAVVQMDGIGGVGTEEGFRNQGYSRRVMETAVEEIDGATRRSRPCSASRTSIRSSATKRPDPSTPSWRHSPDAAAATHSLPRGWRFRPLTAADMPAVKGLYHAQHQTGDRRARPP